MKIPNTNDGTDSAPHLKVYLNTDNLLDLPTHTRWSGSHGHQMILDLKKDGFEGVQQYFDAKIHSPSPLPICSLDRINTAKEADTIASKYAGRGYDCITVHAGWGIENDKEMFEIVEAILNASDRHNIPIYIETHRATITQDIWRTVQITKKFPEVRFNGDFSHYYCGQELVYGGLEMKMEFMAPIFDRVAFMHARIASPGQIQASIGTTFEKPTFATGETDYLSDFKTIWTRAMKGWLSNARPGDYFIFCPELLSRRHYYAKTFRDSSGTFHEESDRYAEALLYMKIARECFSSCL